MQQVHDLVDFLVTLRTCRTLTTAQQDTLIGLWEMRSSTPGLSQEDEGASYRQVHGLQDGQRTRQDQCEED